MKDKLKVLLATDFSRNSKALLRNLGKIREELTVDVFFVHVIASFWKDWLASGLYQKEAMQRLQSWQQELVGSMDPKKLFVELGNRADNIISTAQALKVDLIILGGKDASSEGRYKSGATAEDVVRHAKVSVLISKNEKVSKILCGIDGSPSSAKALQWAMQLAQRLDAKLVIIFVISKVSASALGMDEQEILLEEAKIEKDNSSKIKDFLKNFDFTGVDYETQFKWGIPSHVLLDIAEDSVCDMIVIGAKGHSRLHNILIGSTAEKVLRFTPCSLLVVR